jgi:hypothetical protein
MALTIREMSLLPTGTIPFQFPFLVVDSGQYFLFGILPRRPVDQNGRDDCKRAADWLREP